MKIAQDTLNVRTRGRGTYNVTASIEQLVRNSGIETGLCHVFIRHTSASLIITENADPDVRRDLETIFSRLAPDGDPDYYHTLEGDDDMSAHIRTVLTQTEMTLPISHGRLGLGTWQGLFVWEHRAGSFKRQLIVTIQG